MPTAETEIQTLPNKEIIRFISHKKNEPQWLLDWRLKAYRHWLTMTEPHAWPMIKYPPIDYQSVIYYSAPKQGAKYASINDVPKEILETYDKLGIPLKEREALLGIKNEAQSQVAVDAV